MFNYEYFFQNFWEYHFCEADALRNCQNSFFKKKIFPKNQQNLVADDRISREKKIIDTFNSYSRNIVQGLFTLTN